MLDKFEKFTHNVPLMSLDDIFSREEVDAFCDRVAAACGYMPEFVVEQKIDGLSVAATYENGILTVGATRGDGVTGGWEDGYLTCVGHDAPFLPQIAGDLLAELRQAARVEGLAYPVASMVEHHLA